MGQRGAFLMRMLDYVHMANERMRQNANRADELAGGLARAYAASGAGPVRIVASGSSLNAAYSARSYIQRTLRVPVYVVTPEAYIKYEHETPADAFTFAISQSGCSSNINRALDFMGGLGMRRIAVTGNTHTEMADHADVLVDYGVGVESVEFVTMGVITLVLFLFLFAILAAGEKGLLDDGGKDAAFAQLRAAIDAHGEMLALMPGFVAEHRLDLARKLPTIFAGTGPNYGVAMEASLKFQETLKRPAEFYELEEVQHGPALQLTPDHALVLMDDGFDTESVIALYKNMRTVSSAVFLLSPGAEEADPFQLRLPKVADVCLQPLVSMVFAHYVCAQMSDELDTLGEHPYFLAIERKVSGKTAGYVAFVEGQKERAKEAYGE